MDAAIALKEGESFSIGERLYSVRNGRIVRRGNVFKTLDADNVMKAVCGFFAVSPDELRDRARHQHTADARRVFCYIMRNYSAMSTSQIGGCIGRSHSDVVHHIKGFEEMKCFFKSYQEAYDEILSRLGVKDRKLNI